MISMYCQTPECERPVEGTTGFCASCNKRKRYTARHLSAPPKEKKPLRKVSEYRELDNEVYKRMRQEFLIQNPTCGCCGQDPATEVHHMKGRTNELLLERQWWLQVCHTCHTHITQDSAWAIKEGYSISRTKETV